MTAILQITDGTSTTPLIDLNATSSGAGYYARRGMNLTQGQLDAMQQQARADVKWSSLSGSSALGRRQLTFPFLLVGSSSDDAGAKVAALNTAVQQPWWLRVRRHGATQDNWLQCFPCVPQIGSQITSDSRPWVLPGVIQCETEPYAIGARVDVGSSAVGQDPNTTAFGYDVNSVGGDAPTPLLIRLNDSTAFANAMGAYVSVRRRGTPGNLTAANLTRQAESGSNTLTNGTNLTLATITGDTALSGDAGVRATFASGYAALTAAQITFAAPSLPSSDANGVYRLLVRIRRNGTAATAGGLVLKAFTEAALITPDEVPVPAGGTDPRVIDLGLVQWPSGQPAAIAAPVTASQATTNRVTLQFWRTIAGAATIDFDWMAWIPADEDAGYLSTETALSTPASQYVNIDGYSHQAVWTDADPTGTHAVVSQLPAAAATPNPTFVGGGPRVSPGANRLLVVAGLSPVTAWPKTQTLTVRASYWPRYTWLR